MRIEDWLEAACADAERRGLPELRPLLETLARSSASLRLADAEIGSAPPPPPSKAPDSVE